MKTNSSTKTILLLAVGLFFLSCLFPSWIGFVGKEGRYTELSLGYGFLFTMPEPNNGKVHIRIDFNLLFLEWAFIALGAFVALCLDKLKVRDDKIGSAPAGKGRPVPVAAPRPMALNRR